MPCPSDVNIPNILTLFNEGHMYNDIEIARVRYGNWFQESHAGLCVECGNCEDLCPQSLPIIEWLAKVHELLGED